MKDTEKQHEIKTDQEERRSTFSLGSPSHGVHMPGWHNEADLMGGNNRHVNFSARLYTDPWQKEAKDSKEGGNPLYKSLGGRVLTRTISRGLFGATFMTLGNLAVRTWDPYMPVCEMGTVHKGMTYLSRGFQTVLGTPIAAVFGEEAVQNFRSKKNFSATHLREATERALAGEFVPISEVTGRNLGEEMVGKTFDFAAGSFGDALGREFMSVLDPNYHTDWMQDGHINFKNMAKDVGQSVWKAVSYHQMEDWAAALPYVYQMRGQRALLSKQWPGVKFTLDHEANGGSFRIDEKGHINGSYMAAGALDLQCRFMGYNFYTLMFRDLYNHVASKFQEYREGEPLNIGIPKHPIEATGHAASETIKYVGKSFIKSMLYMAPAVPFFWMTRTPASRHNAFFVSEDNGLLVDKHTLGVGRDPRGPRFKAENKNGVIETTTTSGDFISVGQIKAGNWKDGKLFTSGENAKEVIPNLKGDRITPDFFSKSFDPYSKEYIFGKFEAALNPIGRASRNFSRFVSHNMFKPFTTSDLYTKYVSQREGVQQMLARHPEVFNRHNIANTYINSAMAYTPYMIAKYETANHIDMPYFDAATYRFLDGIHHGQMGEIKQGLKDMASVVVRAPISEGTVAAAEKPRGLVNSMHETAKIKEEKQGAISRARLENEKGIRSTLKEQGSWSAYETARAQTQENGPPEGVTIH